jgi:predicted dehydrogenase
MSVGWGILSTGGIAGKFVEDLKLLPDATVAAVGSRALHTAEAFAARHDIPRVHGSWAELAADPAVDVVYVATPHSAHFAASKLCLEAGKAVLCEKPFTLNLATSTELVNLARERGRFLMEAMWTRTIPAIREIQTLIADGAIGEVTYVSADFGVPGPFPVGHRMRAPELGGGALLDLGVYPVTFAHMFLGTPASISGWASLLPEGTDENTALILGYDSGAVATLQCGIVGESAQRGVITGTTGRIEVDRFIRPTEFTLIRSGAEPERFEVPVRGNGMGYEADEVMSCLTAGLTESRLVPLDATLEVMRTLDTALATIGVSYPLLP